MGASGRCRGGAAEVVAIVVGVGAVQAAPPLDRHVAVGVGKALDARAAASPAARASSSRSLRVGPRRRGSSLRRGSCARRTPPRTARRSAPDRPRSRSIARPLNGGSGQPDVVEDGRHAAEGQHAAHLQHRRRRCAAQARARRRLRRAGACSRRWCARPGLRASPRSGTSRRKRNCTCSSACVATKVPLPWRRTTRFSAASSSIALRTVPWLTLKRAARSISLGIGSPGFHSPACRLCRISALICWYSGLNDGRAPSAGRWVGGGMAIGGGACMRRRRKDANLI